MANLEGFNASEHEPFGVFEVIPKGQYLAVITDSEMKATASGSGEYLQLSWQLLEGSNKGQIIFDRLNLKNSNQTAVKIANSQLASICNSVNVPRPKDSAELHNKPVLIKIDVEERNDKPGVMRNIIKGYDSPKNKVEPSSIATGSVGSTPPWKK